MEKHVVTCQHPDCGRAVWNTDVNAKGECILHGEEAPKVAEPIQTPAAESVVEELQHDGSELEHEG